MTNTQPTIDLHQYWDVLRSRKLAIIIPTLAAIALAAAFIVLQKPQYTAQARVLVNPLLSPDPAGTTAKSNVPDMNTEQATAASAPVANLARSSLNVSNTGDRLLNHLKVTAASTGNILLFQYTSPNAQQAAQYANAFAQAYITYRNNSVLEPLAKAIAQKKQAITALSEQIQHSGPVQKSMLRPQFTYVASQLATFESDQQLVSGGILIGSAVPPPSPSSPKITTTLVIAAVIGLVLGILLALIREGMDRRIKSPDEMETQLRAPVLGVIPKFKGRSPERSLVTISDPRSPASEAYRTTAIALENLAARAGVRMIMFASPKAGGGASTTTANVGAVLAQAGHQVILVSADLRSPTLHLILGLPDGRGLSTALMDGANSTDRLLKGTRIPNLFLLNAGPEPEDPAALLSSPATTQVFSALQALKPNFILVDAPPVLSVSDAMILSRQVDGTVVTWNSEAFQAPALSTARERLERAGANILGGILSFDSGKPRGGASPARGELSRPQAADPRDARRVAARSMAEDSYDSIDPSPLRERPAGAHPTQAPGRVRP
jgi:succinoglycan biosynthesis transport protein ExoP